MKLVLDVNPESPFIRTINEELARENETLKDRISALSMKKQKKKKIIIRGVRKKKGFVNVKFGDKKLKIYHAKKNVMPKGYFAQNSPNFDEIIDKKISEALKKKSKIHLNVKPSKIEKKIVVKFPARETKVSHVKKHAPKIKYAEPKAAVEYTTTPPKRHIRLKVLGLPEDEEKRIRKSGKEPVMVKAGKYAIPIIVKPPEEKETMKTGYFGAGGMSDMSALIPLLSKLVKPDKEEEEKPIIKGIKIPEV
jgi:hypothetical protein